MSLLKNLKTESDIKQETDNAGGGFILPSDLYDFTIALAYVKPADSGALGLFLELKTDDGKTLKTSMYMTSGTAKGGKNYSEKDGVKTYLPGFNQANGLCLLTIGKEIGDLETEEKVVKLYDYNAKSEVPTKVQALTDLHGKRIKAGVLEQKVNKTKKNEVTKQYEPTGETRQENEVDKFFRAEDGFTVAELRASAEKAEFMEVWVEKNKGKVRDKTKGAAGTAGAPKGAAAGTTKPTTSLFGG